MGQFHDEGIMNDTITLLLPKVPVKTYVVCKEQRASLDDKLLGLLVLHDRGGKTCCSTSLPRRVHAAWGELCDLPAEGLVVALWEMLSYLNLNLERRKCTMSGE